MKKTHLFVLGLFAFFLSILPFLFIAKARELKSPETRISIIWHMDKQPKFTGQSPNPLYRDNRAMRHPPEHTVAYGAVELDEHLYDGRVGGEWARTFPEEIPLTPALMERGRERYDIFCAPCHGVSGYGDGIVSQRAIQRQQAQWIPPVSYYEQTVLGRPVGHLYNTITNGIRTMPAYRSQIPVEDRWAIVAYVRALQTSQTGRSAVAQAAELEAQARAAADANVEAATPAGGMNPAQ